MKMNSNHPLLKIANGLSGGQIDSLSEAVELYGKMAFTESNNNTLLQERIAELELAVDDIGYDRIGDNLTNRQFTKTTIDKIAAQARVYWLKNPLIKRATATQANYVFGQGMSVDANDDVVQEVIDEFMKDSKNKAELTGEQAMLVKETELQVMANLFFTFFTDPGNGATRVRTIPLGEISRIIYNPEDGKEPWYYLRKWQQPKEAGSNAYESRQAMYPDINYNPKTGLPNYFNGIEVMRDNPVYHVKTNCLSDMEYGVSELYAAVDWAKAYKDFLTDWFTIVKSLSKFAWKATTKSGAIGQEKVKDVLQSTLNGDYNPANGDLPGQSAQVWMSSDNVDLTPMPKSGATISAEDGRRALLMVCAATGIYEHYFGDPSTGNLATAKAMEQPMLLMFSERQEQWTDVFSVILDYAIDQSATKAGGSLQGTRKYNNYGESCVDTGTLDRSFNIVFPPILQEDITERVDAIVKSVTLGGQGPADTIDLKSATTMLLNALGEDTDIIDKLFPDESKSWADVDAEKQEQALQIAAGQQSQDDQQVAQAAKASGAIDNASDTGDDIKNAKTPEDKAAAAVGQEESAVMSLLDNMVKELREKGI